jgi:hypothetical protein
MYRPPTRTFIGGLPTRQRGRTRKFVALAIRERTALTHIYVNHRPIVVREGAQELENL